MTVVIAAPEQIVELGRLIHRGASEFRRQGMQLRSALTAFFAGRFEFGPRSSHLPGVIAAEAQFLEALEIDLSKFVETLRLADAAGATWILRGRPESGRAVLVIDERVLETYAPVDSTTTVSELIERLRRQHRAHEGDPAEQPSPYSREYVRWRGEGLRLAGQIRQLETAVEPPYQSWGGVAHLDWVSASAYLEAVDQGRIVLDDQPSMGPFTAAARGSGATLSHAHLGVLDRLDELALMPLDAFIEARARAHVNDPWFDWTSDGCSGPIPPGAAETCLRHDFLYRNSRLLRDQWGLDPVFARKVKQYADDAFGRELDDSYAEWIKAVAPPLRVWIDAAELAVTVVGDVGQRWNPPREGRFYGSETPHD